MRELQGLSHEDIAIALQTSVGAAKQAIFEARRGLAEAAEGREMSCEDIRQLISDGDRRVLRGRRVAAHLRSCSPCADFASAIAQRRADLRALAPALTPVAAASILARASGGLGGHGTSGGLGAATAGTGSLGKGALAAVSSKVAVGAAVLATATAGVAGVAVLKPLFHRHRVGPSATARSVRGAPAQALSGAGPQAGAPGRTARVARGVHGTGAVAQSGHRGHAAGIPPRARPGGCAMAQATGGRAQRVHGLGTPGRPSLGATARARAPRAAKRAATGLAPRYDGHRSPRRWASKSRSARAGCGQASGAADLG